MEAPGEFLLRFHRDPPERSQLRQTSFPAILRKPEVTRFPALGRAEGNARGIPIRQSARTMI